MGSLAIRTRVEDWGSGNRMPEADDSRAKNLSVLCLFPFLPVPPISPSTFLLCYLHEVGFFLFFLNFFMFLFIFERERERAGEGQRKRRYKI